MLDSASRWCDLNLVMCGSKTTELNLLARLNPCWPALGRSYSSNTNGILKHASVAGPCTPATVELLIVPWFPQTASYENAPDHTGISRGNMIERCIQEHVLRDTHLNHIMLFLQKPHLTHQTQRLFIRTWSELGLLCEASIAKQKPNSPNSVQGI